MNLMHRFLTKTTQEGFGSFWLKSLEVLMTFYTCLNETKVWIC